MRALGRARQAKGREYYDGDVNLPAFLTAKNLKPFIDSDLYVTSSQIIFRRLNGGRAFGYPAEMLPKVCEVFLKARDANALTKGQEHIAILFAGLLVLTLRHYSVALPRLAIRAEAFNVVVCLFAGVEFGFDRVIFFSDYEVGCHCRFSFWFSSLGFIPFDAWLLRVRIAFLPGLRPPGGARFRPGLLLRCRHARGGCQATGAAHVHGLPVQDLGAELRNLRLKRPGIFSSGQARQQLVGFGQLVEEREEGFCWCGLRHYALLR
jgi:hypothetical protein